MNWKDLNLGKKFATGFGVVLVLLAALVIMSYLGVGGIVTNAGKVIDGNKLDGNLAQKEVDHLNWTNKVNTLLTDENMTELAVEIDDHKCSFGKWLYGEGREQAEALVPSLAPLLKKIEEPHRKLHESAIEIGKVFIQADLELGNLLREKKTDHLAWTHKIKDAFLDQSINNLDVQMDPKKCGLGKWMYSPETAKLKLNSTEFAAFWNELEPPHNRLHGSAEKIQAFLSEGKRNEAIDYFNEVVQPIVKETLGVIDKMLKWRDAQVHGMEAANNIYATNTLPALKEVQGILKEIREEAKKHIMTDQVMLNEARATKRNVTIVGLAATIVGILFAFFIARGLVGLISKSVDFAEKMAEGDFTQTLDIDQKDEIGTLAEALNNMDSNLSQMFKGITDGVETLSSSSTELSAISQQMSAGSEQTSSKSNTVASAAEEMSSNMNSVAAAMEQAATNVNMVATAAEEMTATVNEIAQNSERARSITDEAVSQSKSASDKVDELGIAANEISKVTEVITEISEQTNLLALNATIEAARAGEAGKGFAVVANEIKELARQTAEATQEIKSKIEGIQGSTDETVTEIGQISKVINDVNEIVSTIATAVEEQSVTTQEIAGNVVQASQGISEVNQNVAQSSTVSGEIAKDIADVNQSAGEMSNSSSQVNKSAEELLGLARQLKEIVGKFKI